MILQVHDELLFEAPEEEIPRLQGLVKDVMEERLQIARAAACGNKSRPELARHEVANRVLRFARLLGNRHQVPVQRM